MLKCLKDIYFRGIYEIIEPPPLPVTLPPVGSHNIKQTRISSSTLSSYSSGSNNNSEGMIRTTTSWHSQTQNVGFNNNGENLLSNQMLNNNFLDNERATSAIAAG